jgi:hypothetical protein
MEIKKPKDATWSVIDYKLGIVLHIETASYYRRIAREDGISQSDCDSCDMQDARHECIPDKVSVCKASTWKAVDPLYIDLLKAKEDSDAVERSGST